MRRLALAFIALTVMVPSLSGCTALGVLGAIGSVSSITGTNGVQCQTSLTVAKSYYGFEAGYNGVAQGVSAIAGTSVLPTGSAKAQEVKGYYVKLMAVRKSVEDGVAICNTGQLSQQIAAGMVLVADLQMLIGKAKANPGG